MTQQFSSSPGKYDTDVYVDANIRETETIHGYILALPLPRKTLLKLCLIAEECFVNICSYAYEGRPASERKVRFSLAQTDRVFLRFEDNGIPYDPLSEVSGPVTKENAEFRIGGLGKFISFSFADDVRYEYREHKNILTLVIDVPECPDISADTENRKGETE